jgi:hypothetical protein
MHRSAFCLASRPRDLTATIFTRRPDGAKDCVRLFLSMFPRRGAEFNLSDCRGALARRSVRLKPNKAATLSHQSEAPFFVEIQR